MLKNAIPSSQKTHCFPIVNTKSLMLLKGKPAVCFLQLHDIVIFKLAEYIVTAVL
jgi:hypothetical protein